MSNAIPEGEIIKKQIVHKLTGSEQESTQKDLLEALKREESILDEKKVTNREIGQRLKAVRKTIKGCRDALDNGQEERTVECYEVANLATFTIQTRRLDTRTMVDERAMTVEESGFYRQPDLYGGAADATEVPHVFRRKPKAAESEPEDGEDPDEGEGDADGDEAEGEAEPDDGDGDDEEDDEPKDAAEDFLLDDDEDNTIAITDPGALISLAGGKEDDDAAPKKRKKRGA